MSNFIVIFESEKGSKSIYAQVADIREAKKLCQEATGEKGTYYIYSLNSEYQY